jgi:hypothetical protein
LAQRQAAQQPAPTPVVAQALLDTGSNVTGVAASLIQQLPLTPYAQSQTQGLSGTTSVRLFYVSLIIFDPAQPHGPRFTQPNLLVMELPPSSTLDVLIGMDVLLDCRMLPDGPGRQLTLDF